MRNIVSTYLKSHSIWALAPVVLTSAALGTHLSLAADPICDTSSSSILCEFVSVEDLVLVPDTNWVLVSSYSTAGRSGEGVTLVDAATRERQLISWTTLNSARPEGCPGPLQQDQLSPQGMAFGPGQNGINMAYVVT